MSIAAETAQVTPYPFVQILARATAIGILATVSDHRIPVGNVLPRRSGVDVTRRLVLPLGRKTIGQDSIDRCIIKRFCRFENTANGAEHSGLQGHNLQEHQKVTPRDITLTRPSIGRQKAAWPFVTLSRLNNMAQISRRAVFAWAGLIEI